MFYAPAFVVVVWFGSMLLFASSKSGVSSSTMMGLPPHWKAYVGFHREPQESYDDLLKKVLSLIADIAFPVPMKEQFRFYPYGRS